MKGSFYPQVQIYTEILFVLHQIVDRMDNLLNLRTKYGSGPLEEFNTQLYAYRRNVAGSIALCLFTIKSALMTKTPLPQFMPSARLAHLRMVNKVREVVMLSPEANGIPDPHPHMEEEEGGGWENAYVNTASRHRALRRQYLSWNASSAAQAEIIEYLEELIDLTKLLVGANEFRSGLFVRPQYEISHPPGGDTNTTPTETATPVPNAQPQIPALQSTVPANDGNDEDPASLPETALRRRRRTTNLSLGSLESVDDGIPGPLMRIQSRKREAGLRRASASTRDRGKDGGGSVKSR